MPKVSIIVPVYNVENYLERCLESLVNQTLQDIEIIIVNDGSTDNSDKIITKYKRKYLNKIVYLKKQNGGLSDARNYGLPYASGEYVAFLDSDDYVEEDMYEIMYKKAKEEKADFVECDFYWEYPDKKKIDTGRIYKDKHEMLAHGRVVAWNKLIKRSILITSNITFPKGLRYEDVEFFYKLIPYLNRIGFVKKPLIHYIQREESIANSQNIKTKDIFTILDNVIKYYRELGIYEKYEPELEYNYARYLLCRSLLRMVKVKNKRIRKMLVHKTWKLLNVKFPNWKKNSIIKTDKSPKCVYMRTVNKVTYPIYASIFSIL